MPEKVAVLAAVIIVVCLAAAVYLAFAAGKRRKAGISGRKNGKESAGKKTCENIKESGKGECGLTFDRNFRIERELIYTDSKMIIR